MNFYEEYKEDIIAFLKAFIDLFKAIFAKFQGGETEETEAAE